MSLWVPNSPQCRPIPSELHADLSPSVASRAYIDLSNCNKAVCPAQSDHPFALVTKKTSKFSNGCDADPIPICVSHCRRQDPQVHAPSAEKGVLFVNPIADGARRPPLPSPVRHATNGVPLRASQRDRQNTQGRIGTSLPGSLNQAKQGPCEFAQEKNTAAGSTTHHTHCEMRQESTSVRI